MPTDVCQFRALPPPHHSGHPREGERLDGWTLNNGEIPDLDRGMGQEGLKPD